MINHYESFYGELMRQKAAKDAAAKVPQAATDASAKVQKAATDVSAKVKKAAAAAKVQKAATAAPKVSKVRCKKIRDFPVLHLVWSQI